MPAPASPMKFLCSFGGKILPRPSNFQLSYVGGENRVVAVPRSVSFAALKEKMANLIGADPVIKYLMAPEDLSTLVTVAGDEDLRHMMEESDRRVAECSCSRRHGRLLRVFLFPRDATAPDPPQFVGSSTPPEQNYVDAANGSSGKPAAGTPAPVTAGIAAVAQHGMQRVHSAPNLCCEGIYRGRRRRTPWADGGGQSGYYDPAACAAACRLPRRHPPVHHPRVQMPLGEGRVCACCGVVLNPGEHRWLSPRR